MGGKPWIVIWASGSRQVQRQTKQRAIFRRPSIPVPTHGKNKHQHVPDWRWQGSSASPPSSCCSSPPRRKSLPSSISLTVDGAWNRNLITPGSRPQDVHRPYLSCRSIRRDNRRSAMSPCRASNSSPLSCARFSRSARTCLQKGQHVDHAGAALQLLPSGIRVECWPTRNNAKMSLSCVVI